VVEDRDAILVASLAAAYDDVVHAHGPPDAGGWRWDHVRFDNINHLLFIPSFSVLKIPVQGGTGTLNPSYGDGGAGPSWRMVVELGPEVHAWGIYPGGQSGSPLSAHYTDRLAKWEHGELDALYFPRSLSSFGRASASLTLTPTAR
jgi:penicillin amidase